MKSNMVVFKKTQIKLLPWYSNTYMCFFTGLLILKGAICGAQITYIHCFLLVPPPSWNQNTMRRLRFPLFKPQKYLLGLIKRSVKIYTL